MIEDIFQYDPDLYIENSIWNEVYSYIEKFEKIKRSRNRKNTTQEFELFTLEEEFRIEQIMSIDNFDKTQFEPIGFISKFKALMVNKILENNDKDLHHTIYKDIIADVNYVLSFAKENVLQDQFIKQIDVLDILNNQLSQLQLEAQGSLIFKSELFKIEESLKSQIEGMFELSAFTAISQD